MMKGITELQNFLVERGNMLSYSQLVRYERLIRDLKDLAYDVYKSNYGLAGSPEESSAMRKMLGVSSEQKD